MAALPTNARFGLSNIVSIFAPGKLPPYKLSDFYKQGAYVADTDINPYVVPTTGRIGIGNFRGARKYIAPQAKSVSFTSGFTAPADVQSTSITGIYVYFAARLNASSTPDPNYYGTWYTEYTLRCVQTDYTVTVGHNSYTHMALQVGPFDFTPMKNMILAGQTYTFELIASTYPLNYFDWRAGSFQYTYNSVFPPSPYANVGLTCQYWKGTNSWGTSGSVTIYESSRMDTLATTTVSGQGKTSIITRLTSSGEQWTNIGQKYTGVFVPLATGTHTFTVSGDDYTMMWLGSTAATPGTTNTTGNSFCYAGFNVNDNRQTASISLTAGTAYPFLLYYGETNWSGHTSLTVTLPDTSQITDLLGYVFS